MLKYIEIESTRAHLETRTQDLKKETEAVANLQKQQAEEEKISETLAAELVEVQAALRSSDYGQKQKELTELERVRNRYRRAGRRGKGDGALRIDLTEKKKAKGRI